MHHPERRNSRIVSLAYIAWHSAMISLALLSGALLLYESLGNPSSTESAAIRLADLLIALVFLAEFSVRFASANERARFFKENWWELLAAIPVTTPLTQSLRLVRLLRIAKLIVHLERLRENR